MDFLKPSIFYFLLLLAIPIIIHLFNFRKHKKIYFSSIFMLQSIQSKHQSKRIIKKWILLLNRLSIISIIICAFALPFIKDDTLNKDVSKIGIYIDNSFSMDRTDNQKNKLIDYAKKNAKSIISELKPTQKILIITNDFERKHQKWYSKEEALILIDSITISSHTQHINTIIHKYNQSIDSVEFNSLYIFSDFQKTKDEKILKLNQTTSIKIGALNGIKKTGNISVDSCYFSNPFRKQNHIENLHVVFTNHGDEPLETLAQLAINNKKTTSYSVEIPAKSSIVKTLNYINPTNTDQIKGLIQIEDMSIQFDNKLYFAYSTEKKVPVLNIYDEQSSSCFSHLYSDSLFEFKSHSIHNMEYHQLSNYNLIILDQLKNIPKQLQEELEYYIANGNNLFVFPNKDLNTKSYNDFFKKIGVHYIDQWTPNEKKVNFINYQHPIFLSVFKEEVKNINLPSSKGFFSITENKKVQNRDILNFFDNSSFLSEYIYKKGSIFMYYSSLSTDESNFTKHALFVPILYNAALINQQKNNLYEIIENETIIEKHGIKNNNIVHLTKSPHFDMIATLQANNQKSLINFHNKIQEDGHYKLIVNEQYQPIAFNYNRRESNIEFLNKVDIKSMFANNIIDFIKLKKNTILKSYQKNNLNVQLEYFFIVLAIMLLIIELFLLKVWKT